MTFLQRIYAQKRAPFRSNTVPEFHPDRMFPSKDTIFTSFAFLTKKGIGFAFDNSLTDIFFRNELRGENSVSAYREYAFPKRFLSPDRLKLSAEPKNKHPEL